MQIVGAFFKALDSDFAGCISGNNFCAFSGFIVALHMIHKTRSTFSSSIFNEVNAIGAISFAFGQRKGCTSQRLISFIVFIELVDFDFVSINLAFIRVGSAGSSAIRIVAVFQMDLVGCGVGMRSIFVDVSLVGHNDFVTSGNRSASFFIDSFQVIKADGQSLGFRSVSCSICACILANDFIINFYSYAIRSRKIQTLSHSIDELKGIPRVVAHVGNFGSKLESHFFADLCSAIRLKLAIGRILDLFLNGRISALDGRSGVTTVFRYIDQHRICTALFTTRRKRIAGRAHLREYQIVARLQIRNGSSRSTGNISCWLGFFLHSSSKGRCIIPVVSLCIISQLCKVLFRSAKTLYISHHSVFNFLVGRAYGCNITRIFHRSITGVQLKEFQPGIFQRVAIKVIIFTCLRICICISGKHTNSSDRLASQARASHSQ